MIEKYVHTSAEVDKSLRIHTMIEKWQEEFDFCERQEMINTQNKEYIIAHNHAIRKEQIRLFIKDLQQVKK